MSTPKENQEAAQHATGYGPIWLRREGDYAIVEVEFDGEWVEVIREHIDGNFSHCVHPVGIQEQMYRALMEPRHHNREI